MPATLMTSPTTRQHTPEALELGIRHFFGLEIDIHDSDYLEEIFTVKGSRKQTESDVVHALLGQALPKVEGTSPTYDTVQEVYKRQTTHTTFALAVEITEEAIEDNLYVELAELSGRALGASMRYTRQVQAMSFFNDLTETTYVYDGTSYQILEYAGHPVLTGATWSNRPQNAQLLSVASLEERLQAWPVVQLDQKGLKKTMRPAETLLVGASNDFMGRRILESPQRAQSADNDINPLRRFKLSVFMHPHLTDDGRWFVIGSKRDTALTFNDRVADELRKIAPSDTGNVRMRCRSRFSKSCVHSLGVMGSPAV